MPPTRVGEIPRERRGVTTDTALRLARYFGTCAEFWPNLQSDYDLLKARMKLASVMERDVQPHNLEAIGA
jgi:addiction module HigA family antidote